MTWNQYRRALDRFSSDPSLETEAAAIAAYAAWAHEFCPGQADNLITLFCGRIAERFAHPGSI